MVSVSVSPVRIPWGDPCPHARSSHWQVHDHSSPGILVNSIYILWTKNVQKFINQPEIAMKLIKTCGFSCQIPYFVCRNRSTLLKPHSDTCVKEAKYQNGGFSHRLFCYVHVIKHVFGLYSFLITLKNPGGNKIIRYFRLVTGCDRKILILFKQSTEMTIILRHSPQKWP